MNIVNYEHALRCVAKEHTGIFGDDGFLWNRDEADVCNDRGSNVKVFGASDTRHSVYFVQRGERWDKHMTPVVFMPASGKKCFLVFIVAGKNVMSSWFRPLKNEGFGNDKTVAWFPEKKWFPQDALVLKSDNGSMEQRLIHLVIENVNNYVRKFVPFNLAYCLKFDGHSSHK